jgi:hypothetical protein
VCLSLNVSCKIPALQTPQIKHKELGKCRDQITNNARLSNFDMSQLSGDEIFKKMD